MGHTIGDYTCFSGARTGEDQKRSVRGENGFALALVQFAKKN